MEEGNNIYLYKDGRVWSQQCREQHNNNTLQNINRTLDLHYKDFVMSFEFILFSKLYKASFKTITDEDLQYFSVRIFYYNRIKENLFFDEFNKNLKDVRNRFENFT